MSIETDESLWPEGAQFYGPETEHHKACFYKPDEDGHWWICYGTKGSPWNISGVYIPRKMDDLIPRPTAPWPQAGVECEYQPFGLKQWFQCKVICRHEDFLWLLTKGGPLTVHFNKAEFRPFRTLRDELIKLLDGYDWLADAVLEKYELTRKQK